MVLNDKMEELKNELKNCLKKYHDADNQLRQVNKLASELRERRKIIEFEMADILKQPPMIQVGVLRLENDNSMIKIQRPGTYNKAWSMSKKDLQNYLDHYFANVGQTANARACFEFILQQQKNDSVETDFKFTRNIPTENVEIE